MVTASTHRKAHHFRGAERLRVLHRGLLSVARDFGWRLEAWAVFSNHCHFIAHSPADAASLADMLSRNDAVERRKWKGRQASSPVMADGRPARSAPAPNRVPRRRRDAGVP
jgi:putative transposase